MSVLKAAESGTYRDLLVALRDLIARTIDAGCAPRDLVGLSKRLIDLADEIRSVDAKEESPTRLKVVDEAFDPMSV